MTDTLNTTFTAKSTKAGYTQSPYDLLFNGGATQSKTEEEEDIDDLAAEGRGYSEEEENGEEEEEEEEEQLQMEVISDSITQTAEPLSWQVNTQSAQQSATVGDTSVTLGTSPQMVYTCTCTCTNYMTVLGTSAPPHRWYIHVHVLY